MTDSWHTRRGDSTTLRLLIQPNARRTEVVGVQGSELKIRVAAPAHEGKANAELVRFVATTLGVPKRAVTIAHGASSRHKTVRIDGTPVLTPLEAPTR